MAMQGSLALLIWVGIDVGLKAAFAVALAYAKAFCWLAF